MDDKEYKELVKKALFLVTIRKPLYHALITTYPDDPFTTMRVRTHVADFFNSISLSTSLTEEELRGRLSGSLEPVLNQMATWDILYLINYLDYYGKEGARIHNITSLN